MDKVLVACRAGVGSSLMLKVKLNEVKDEENWPIQVEHTSLDELDSFDGKVVVCLSDVAEELNKSGNYTDKEIVGIKSIINKDEIKTKVGDALKKAGIIK
jgi:PTS system ascorbate-specific IIB component